MTATAAHLVDHVFPARVPVRQWVLSLPIRLRYMLAYDKELCARAVTLFVREIFRWLCIKKLIRTQKAGCGSEIFIRGVPDRAVIVAAP